MKAFTLTEPWASLVAMGVKCWETRSWTTAYRGPLAIHGAKGFPGWARHAALDFMDAGYLPPDFEPARGLVIATCRLVDCVPTRRAMALGWITDTEEALGDYAPGRWAWRLADVRRLPVAVPARGALGLWQWDEDREPVATVRSPAVRRGVPAEGP